MTTPNEHKNLADAFLAAKAEFLEIPKDRENPHFKSRYSTLDAIHTATNPALLKHGLSAYHSTPLVDGLLTVTAILEHAASGEKRENTMSMTVPANVQTIGSHITYLRRYTLSPLLGVCSDEDDDGHAAATTANEPPKASPAVTTYKATPAPKPKADPQKDTVTSQTPAQIEFNAWALRAIKDGLLSRPVVETRLALNNKDFTKTLQQMKPPFDECVKWYTPLVADGTLQLDEIVRRLSEADYNYAQVQADLVLELAEAERKEITELVKRWDAA